MDNSTGSNRTAQVLDRSQGSGEDAVTLTLLDGQKLFGRLKPFRPQATQLCLLPDPLDLEQRAVREVAVEAVAYVAFHRSKEPLVSLPSEQERWRVRTVIGDEWLVYAAPHSVANGSGFVARPVNDTVYDALYLYRHGLISCERDVPLGTILVSSGALGPAALEQGLLIQRRERSMPIGQILVEQKKLDAVTLDEAADLQKQQNLRIGEVLRDAGLLSAVDLDRALSEQRRRKGRRLGEILVDLNALTERDLALTLGHKFALPFVEPEQLVVSPPAVALVGLDLIERLQVLPLALSERALTVAVADPTDNAVVEALRVATKRRICLVVTTSSALKTQIDEVVRRLRASVPADAPSRMDRKTDPSPGAIADDGVGKLLNDLLGDAYRRQISELYVEASGKMRRVTIRYRAGDQWLVHTAFPPIVRNALVARLKAAAQLDVSERRKPQQGIMRWSLGDAHAVLRVTTFPNAAGDEDVALRMRGPSRVMTLEEVGLSGDNLTLVRRVMAWKRGLVLCAGTVGSGKTTMLHSLLGTEPRSDAETLTLEYPIEIVNPACRQIAVGPELGTAFADTARLLLQASPNVLMIGELRDDQTARIAVEGVLRGGLVLAGVAASGAADALLRLECAGIPRSVLGEIPVCVVTTRTVRALCTHCSVREASSRAEYERLSSAYGAERFGRETGVHEAAQLQLARARGCPHCSQTGYQGLLGVHEVVTHASTATGDQRATSALHHVRRSLLHDAICKVVAGRIDLAQLTSLGLD